MKTFQVNLGLNNNPFTAKQVIEYFENQSTFRLIGYYIKTMKFFNVDEPTFVALFEYKCRESTLMFEFENLCIFFNQESIAVKSDLTEFLAFNENFNGEPYKFNSEYFENFKK